MSTVFISGGTGEIGKVLVHHFYELGYDVAFTWYMNSGIADELNGLSGSCRVRGFECDLANTNSVRETFDAFEEWLDSPYVGLINNAGINGGRKLFDSIEFSDIHQVFNVNVFGAMECIRRSLKVLDARDEESPFSIVNISSQLAQYGGFQLSAYASSKGAINALTIALAKELGPKNIRVNSLSPGMINARDEREESKARLELAKESMPMGRLCQTKDVAEAASWLIGDKSLYVSGVILPVHGAR